MTLENCSWQLRCELILQHSERKTFLSYHGNFSRKICTIYVIISRDEKIVHLKINNNDDNYTKVGHSPDFSKADTLAAKSGSRRWYRNESRNSDFDQKCRTTTIHSAEFFSWTTRSNHDVRSHDCPTKTMAIDFLSHFRHLPTLNID